MTEYAAVRFRSGAAATTTTTDASNVVEVHISPAFEVVRVAARAIRSLLKNRDFLGLQLAQAQGCLTEDQLLDASREHMTLRSWSDDDLRREVAALVYLIREQADADVVSTIFRTDLAQAGRALSFVAKQLSDGSGYAALPGPSDGSR
jgi:hypothetical protein